MERRAANLSHVSNFIQLTAETLHQLSLSAPLSDEQLADQSLLTLGLMIASRDLAVMTSVEEVNWRLVRRDTSLADSNLPKEVKTKLRRSKVSSETVFDPAAQSVIDTYQSSVAYAVEKMAPMWGQASKAAYD
jgi:hypothetical protein